MKAKSDDYYFRLAARLAEEKSTCLKIKTGVIIVKDGRVVGEGYNLCSPEGFRHGEKNKQCKRMDIPSGEGYELCKPLHAEVMALISVGAESCRGATLYLSGHYYPCWHCESHARFAGIKKIKVADFGARDFYRRRGQ